MDSQILISYSDSDDPGGRQGWVSTLKEALGFRLGQLLGTELDVRRAGGRGLQGGSSLAVCVLSPDYVASEECLEELRRLAGEGPIFKVVKSPVPREHQPEALRDTLPYEFFAPDAESGEPRELSAASSSRQYWTRIEDLAFDMSRVLGEPPSGTAVFLADVSPDLRSEREQIRRELLQRGFLVLPDNSLPSAANELAAALRQLFARCRLSIHPLGRSYGEIPAGHGESVVELEAELAVEREANGARFSRLIWMPPGLVVEDERQQRLIERLASTSRFEHGSDFLVTPLENLKSTILCVLQETPRGPVEVGDASSSARIFLSCDQRDLGAITPLRKYLEGRSFQVLLPSFEGDESEVRLDIEQKLRLCDAVLIHWGAGSDAWLRGKLHEIQKSPGFGRTRPLPPAAVYLGTPDTEEKRNLDTGQVQVLTAATTEPAAGLAPFLARIQEWDKA